MCTPVLLLLLVVFVPVTRLNGPYRLYREDWGNKLTNAHLVWMSEHICKDAYYKVRMAEKVAEEYRYTYAFELGLLTASIYDRFHHMTKIYRYYVNIKEFQAHKHSLESMLGGYSAMQSDYNQMRAETDLYEQIEAAQLEQEQKENVLAQFLAKKYNMSAVTMKRLIAQGYFSDYKLERRSVKWGFKNGIARKIDPLKEYDFKANPKWSTNPNNEAEVENIMRMNADSRRSFNTKIKDGKENTFDPMKMDFNARRSLNMGPKDEIADISDSLEVNFNPPAKKSTNTKDELAKILKTLKKPKRSKNLWNTEINSNNKNDNELKKQMRYNKWAENWKGFNPETEGVHIPDWIARMGLANESNFLQKELKLV